MSNSEVVTNSRIQAGVEALSEKHGHAKIIAEDDDSPHLYVDMGVIDISGYAFDQEEARIILRIHRDFPKGQNYGMVTVPALTIDGQMPDNTDKNKSKAEALRQAGITEDYLFWSRDWRKVPVSKATDMAKAVAFVHRTLKDPFDN